MTGSHLVARARIRPTRLTQLLYASLRLSTMGRAAEFALAKGATRMRGESANLSLLA